MEKNLFLGLRFFPLYLSILMFCLSTPLHSKEKLRTVKVPYRGYPIDFSEPKGPFKFKKEVIQYETEDLAIIEATVITPQRSPRRPGIVFVHMWARDRNTYWGLPEFLATYGYPSISMDLRGHGNSNIPGTEKKITIHDKKERYALFYLDIVPAIDILLKNDRVRKGQLILIGASLGVPLGVIAASKRKDHFLGMIMLAPALNYFDVYCKKELLELKGIPLYVIAEKVEKTFKSAKEFFNLAEGYKCWLETEQIGHGTDVLFYNIGFPTILLNWIEQIEIFQSPFNNLKKEKFVFPVKK